MWDAASIQKLQVFSVQQLKDSIHSFSFRYSWGPDDDGKTVDGPHFLAVVCTCNKRGYFWLILLYSAITSWRLCVCTTSCRSHSCSCTNIVHTHTHTHIYIHIYICVCVWHNMYMNYYGTVTYSFNSAHLNVVLLQSLCCQGCYCLHLLVNFLVK